MIENTIQNMSDLIIKLKSSIEQDIEDIKAAKHEELLKRNDEKHIMIEKITSLKTKLNEELMSKIQEGIDVNIYRASVDLLEIELKDLYESLDSKEGIIFELGMVPTMKYYTGFMIKGYSDQSATPILSGGRYDDLLPRFNVDKTAVGFCFHMNHILKRLEIY